MATASSPRAAPAAMAGGLGTALLRALPMLATVLGVAAVYRVVFAPWYLNYDARYALLWARDAVEGHLPEYRADFAPTPHPLQTAASALALPFGDAADDLLSLAVLVCLGVLVWLSFRLGAELFSSRAVGIVVALVVATRPALARDAVLAYQDIPFAALIVAAVLLEVRRPRRGTAVLVLLAIAGLLRPEAWVLGGLYWLYLLRGATPRARVLHAGLVAVAPVIWAVSDLVVTGDLLHSLNGTADLAEANDRRRTVGEVPRWTAQYLAYVLREPLLVGVPIGLAFAWYHARRRAILPLAVAAAMLAVFAVGPLFGLPLIGRYVRTPAVLLALFYGLAVFGWLRLAPGPSRTRWAAAGAVAALLSLAYLPWHADRLRGLERRLDRDGALYADIRAMGRAPEVRRAFAACAPVSVADHRPIPFLRFWLDGAPGTVGTPERGQSPLGRLLVLPTRGRIVRRFYRDAYPAMTPPPGFRPIYRNRSWRVLAAADCRA